MIANTEQKYKNLDLIESKNVYEQLPEFTRIARYSQYNKKEGRRETWEEQVERVFKMHKVKFQKYLDNPNFMEMYNYAKNMMNKKRILGSQRALQFGGPSILKKNEKMYNCFSADTRFWTKNGVLSFNDLEDGDNIVIRGRDKWMPATVRNFGKQELLKMTIKCKNKTQEIFATENHRWNIKTNKNNPFTIKTTIELNNGYILQNTENKFGKYFDINFEKYVPNNDWKVVSIEKTDRKEDVWCVVEPEYEEFTLECGVVTKNCAATYVDRPRVFQEIIYCLLCGEGMGFSVQTHHVEKLPNIIKPNIENHKKRKFDKFEEEDEKDGINENNENNKITYIIDDSIEGWADAIGVLLSSYFTENQPFPEYSGKYVKFDYSRIRPKGSPISNIGGKAPGPDGLRKSIEKIRNILDRCTELDETYSKNNEHKLRPIDAYDILMHCSDAVLSGGIRRAATLALFSLHDEEMINAKTGDWYINNPQRARSNNSVLLLRDKVDKEKYNAMIQKVKQFGEPGMIWADDTETLYNPCVPDDTFVETKKGFRQVKDLIGEPFIAVVDGKEYESKTGFVKTGENKQVWKIITKEGFEVRATDNHKILTEEREWVELKDLDIGNVITLNNNSGKKINIDQKSNKFAKGWLMGSLYVNGTFYYQEMYYLRYSDLNHEELAYIANNYLKQLGYTTFHSKNVNVGEITIKNKELFIQSKKYIQYGFVLTDYIEKETDDFQAGFLRGLFDSDGCVKGNIKNGLSIRLKDRCNNIDTLKRVQRMSLRFGIFGKICCKEYVITKSSITNYQNIIGFNDSVKSYQLDEKLSLYKRKQPLSKYTAKIIDIVLDDVCDVYDCTVDDIHAFSANGVYVHNCVEISLYGYDEKGNTGIQKCVSGDTKLITEEGIVNIKNVVGNNIKIWNGDRWSEVCPFKTAENQELYRVNMSDGSYLDCTSQHKFQVKHRFMKDYIEITTEKLIELLKTSKYAIYLPRSKIGYNYKGGKEEKFAYEYGFILGDGSCPKINNDIKEYYRIPHAILMGDKLNLPLRCRKIQNNRMNIYFDDVDRKFSYDLKYKEGLPDIIFSWNRESIINFIAGWIDSDGSKHNKGCRVYGREDKIKDLQLLLTKIGIISSVNLMAKAGQVTNVGIRKQDVWYTQIPNCNELKSYRMKFEENFDTHSKGKNQVIKNIMKLNGLHDTFCLEEKYNHTCLFNNIMTKQCNLSEINMAAVNTKEDFFESCKAAAILGTFQAAYTTFPYLGKITEYLVARESLLGVSMTGMMDTPEIAFNPSILEQGAKIVKETNEYVANIIGINKASRTTCVKPAGSSSCILGTSSGIHPHHAKRYFRRVQVNKLETPLKFFKKYNNNAVTESVWSSNKTDDVITFLCKAKDGAIIKKDLTAIDLLEKVKLVQQHWVTNGRNIELCVEPWLNHNVSNTITIKEDEWEKVADYIYNNRKYFAGISMLSSSGDMIYDQAPFQEVLDHEEISKTYGAGALFASGLIVHAHQAFDNNLYNACSCFLGYGEKLELPKFDISKTSESFIEYDKIYKKIRWIAQANKFTERHFNGDKTKMTYCLKAVDAWKTWCDLKRTYQSVPWEKFYESNDNTKPSDFVACSGDKCEIIKF